MSLLRDTHGLVVLLSSAVLFGILVLGVASAMRAARRPATGAASKAIADAAAKAPTDAHMALLVAGKLVRRLFRKWTGLE